MYTATILFSVLAAMAQAAPLPMPAAKMSDKLASRFYSAEPILYHETPCWTKSYQGVLQDDACVLAAIDVDSNSYGYAHQPSLLPGDACTLNGRQGIWQDATCILANVDVNAKRDLLAPNEFILPDGTCYQNNRRGIWRDGLCDLLEVNLDVNALDNGYPAGTLVPGNSGLLPIDGNPCWLNGRQGFWQNELCVLANLKVSKRYIPSGSEGLAGGLDTLTGDRNAHYYPNGTPIYDADGLSADAEALVDVGSDRRLYARDGLLHKAPSGDVLDSASKSVKQLLDHVAEKRDLLGLSSLPLNNAGHTYKSGDLVSEIEATVNIDADASDEPYYGPSGLKIVPLAKKGLLGSSSSNGGVQGLPALGDLSSSQGNALPLGVPVDYGVVADLTATLGVNADNLSPSSIGGYSSGGKLLGNIVPSHGAGLLQRDLAGLGGLMSGSASKVLLGSTSGTTSGLPVVGDMLKPSTGSGSHKQGGLAGIL